MNRSKNRLKKSLGWHNCQMASDELVKLHLGNSLWFKNWLQGNVQCKVIKFALQLCCFHLRLWKIIPNFTMGFGTSCLDPILFFSVGETFSKTGKVQLDLVDIYLLRSVITCNVYISWTLSCRSSYIRCETFLIKLEINLCFLTFKCAIWFATVCYYYYYYYYYFWVLL